MANHEEYMRRALNLAEGGLGKTAPNPSVGCVIVKNDDIIAEARTSNDGRPHAEVNASTIAGDKAKDATLYVTLEPCNTHGETGPCVKAIIKSEIKTVVIACRDPYQKDTGSIQRLKEAGIEVIENVCRDEAHEINKGFFTTLEKGRPYITVKIATSLDSKIATSTGESKWITGEASRKRVHEIRATYDGTLTGSGTLMADNPQLTVRLSDYDEPQPTRFVVNEHQKLPEGAKIFEDIKESPVYFISSQKPDEKLKAQGIQFIDTPYDDSSFDLNVLTQQLKEMGITRLLIEAGPKTVTSFTKARLVDELLWFKAPILIGSDGIDAFGGLGIEKLSQSSKPELKSREMIGDDVFEKWSF